jgi:hypothetical protein
MMQPGALSQSDTPRVDKAALLNGFYLYLGGRIDSVGRRASFMMALLGSFLGVASAAITHGQPTSMATKLAFLLTHPSILTGIAAMGTLLLSEIAKISTSNDLFSRIGFSDEATPALQTIYRDATINELFGELIANARVVGSFLKRKVRLYNTGSVLFVVSVVLFLCGL